MRKKYTCNDTYLMEVRKCNGFLVETEVENSGDARRRICKKCFKLGACGALTEVA